MFLVIKAGSKHFMFQESTGFDDLSSTEHQNKVSNQPTLTVQKLLMMLDEFNTTATQLMNLTVIIYEQHYFVISL